jgi:UDPglucose 6-dehydrogenase
VWCDGPLAAAKSSDVVVVLTEWNELRALDLAALKSVMRGDILVDLRNIYQASEAAAAGLRYVAIGRPPTRQS